MFPRSEAEAIAAHETVEAIFGADAPNRLVDMFNGGHVLQTQPVESGGDPDSTGWNQLKRAADLKENIVKRSEVEAVASSHFLRRLSKTNLGCLKTMVRLVHLIACFQNKSDVEVFWIRLDLIFERTRIAQNKREAMPISHDSDSFPFLLQELEIEAALEEGACFGEVIDFDDGIIAHQ